MAINRTSPKKGKVVDIPTAPTIGTATAGGESATVAYTAATVGGPATTFTALSNPGSITGTGSSSPITVTGLTAGTAYTFTVRGNNATGSSEYTTASNSVTPTASTAFESIATQTVAAGGAASITFNSIPQTYKHLQIRAFLKADSTGRGSITINSGSFAKTHQLFSDGTGAGASPASTFNWPLNFSATANIFGSNVIDLFDYTSTNKTRVFKNMAGVDYNGSGSIFLMSSLDLSTTATNTITLTPSTGNWSQYTHVALYGIKG